MMVVHLNKCPCQGDAHWVGKQVLKFELKVHNNCGRKMYTLGGKGED